MLTTIFIIAILVALVSGALVIGELAIKALMIWVIISIIKNAIEKRKNKDESL